MIDDQVARISGSGDPFAQLERTMAESRDVAQLALGFEHADTPPPEVERRPKY